MRMNEDGSELQSLYPSRKTGRRDGEDVVDADVVISIRAAAAASSTEAAQVLVRHQQSVGGSQVTRNLMYQQQYL